MTFTADQRIELGKPLDPRNVKPPAPGKYGEYIEGWKVIEEANRIFGFDGWSRETVEISEVCRYETTVGRDQKPGWAVGYRAKVRVTVYGDGQPIAREGSAVGNGVSVQLYDAIESAAKEAETDAMKRALMTFGYPFGLALYDKTKANVQAPPPQLPADIADLIVRVEKADTQLELQRLWKTEGEAAFNGPHGVAVNDAFIARKAAVETMDRQRA